MTAQALMNNAAIVRQQKMDLDRSLNEIIDKLPEQGKGAFFFSFDGDEDLLVFVARGWMSQTYAAEVKEMLHKKRELPA